MTASFARFLVVATLAASAPEHAAAQEAVKPNVAIVPQKSKGGFLLPPPQLKALERALKDQVDVVPLKAFQKAARKARVKPKSLATVSGATTVGRELQLTHVVVLEGQSEKIGEGKKKKAVNSTKVTVIAVETSESIFMQNYVLKGRKLTPDVADQIAADLLPRLVPAPPPAVPSPVAETEPPAPPPAAPPPAESALEAPAPPADTPPTLAAGDQPIDPTLAAAPTAADGGPPGAAADATGAPSEAEAALPSAPLTETSASVEPETSRAPRWRPGLIARLGAIGFLRNGKIDDSSETDALSYAPPAGGTPMPMPAGLVQLELYPFALGGRGAWYEGLGIEAEGTYTQVVTEVNATPKETVKSPVFGGRGGLSLRFVLWNSEKAVELRLRGGYGVFQFPLDKGTFPGVEYAGPYAGGALTLPLARFLAVVVAGTYTPMLDVQGGAKRLGTALDKGTAFAGEGGFRLTFSRVEVALMGRMEQYTAAFSGESELAGVVPYVDATLKDTYTGGHITVGVRL